jgi:hypothetical protein
VALVPLRFVSLGSGIVTKGGSQVRFCPGYAPDTQRRRIDSGAVSEGNSTGDFTEALAAILGEKASGLSATNIARLKAGGKLITRHGASAT